MMATWTQVTARWFLRARTGVALTLQDTSMRFDSPRRLRQVAVAAAVCYLIIGLGAYLWSVIRPAGIVGRSTIVMANGSGAKWVRVNGKLSPALNLSSAWLIAGSNQPVASVDRASIDAEPHGPLIGIAGAPEDMPVTNGAAVQVAVCQRVPVNASSPRPVVTLINGGVYTGVRNDELGSGQAAVGILYGQTYLIWNGHKAVIDPNDPIVLSSLGIDRALTLAAPPLTAALGNAIPSALPIGAPRIPEAGVPSPFAVPNPGTPIGTVVRSELPGQGEQFYVVLREGKQQIPETVAAMIRQENSFGQGTALSVGPDLLTRIPTVSMLNIGHYPPKPLKVVDFHEKPVTCWEWERGRTATSAVSRVLSGAELPVSAAMDDKVVKVAGSGGDPAVADQVLMSPDAANWVVATSSAPQASSRETAWWISDRGTKFGVGSSDQERSALGLTGEPLAMPQDIIRLFPRGLPPNTALTRADALVIHDSIPTDPAQKALR
ncbi:UNVERIFIED_ORG: hypothetical protein MaF1660_ph0019 [Mycobacterium phage Adler]